MGSDPVTAVLRQSPLFETLSEGQLAKMVKHGEGLRLGDGDVLAKEGQQSEAFFVLLEGRVTVEMAIGGQTVPISTLGPGDVFGEQGLLLQAPRTATVRARGSAEVLRFNSHIFQTLLRKVPEFGVAVARVLAERLEEVSHKVPVPSSGSASEDRDPGLADLLARDFQLRHRCIPWRIDGDTLVLGFVDKPTRRVVAAVQQQHPSLRIKPIMVSEDALASVGLEQPAAPPSQDRRATPRTSSQGSLHDTLRAMVTEGASDLHLCAGYPPYWRVDGDILRIPNRPAFTPEGVIDFLGDAVPEHFMREFRETHDVDLAYAVPGLGRFRLNLFRDSRGAGAVLRHIPEKLLTLEQLGMPAAVRKLCDHPKGMVLVTGPTGSGKSTTLAAMIDHINKTRRAHIITLEDPIEFVHDAKKCLVNQRDVGNHTASFSRALKAALREDPDIVLVGEMRDLETVALALETANTGHLVFGTLHTATAIGTVDRIVDLFPPEQQSQVRTVLSDSLKGVVAQTLCKRRGGGRVAAVEILVSTNAIANLIRAGKNTQIPGMMQTGRKHGMTLLNEELARLVKEGVVEADEALAKTPEKDELAKRLGVRLDD